MAARQTTSGFSSSDGDLLLGQDLYPSDKSQRNSRTLPAACAMIRKDHMHAVLTGGVGPLPPFPYIDGPLFAVSAPLARALVSDPAPRAYLDGLARQYAVRTPTLVLTLTLTLTPT